jgi:general secretion pathway protein C
MGVDAIFKRYFAAIVCFLIGAAAYFQASGVGALVASSVAVDPSALPSVPPAPPPRLAPAASSDHITSAAAILTRNPFDSVTGPLDGKQIELPTVEGAKVEANENPYDDTDCDVARALMVVASEDPAWSFAALAGTDGKTILRRQGDEIGGYTVDYIGDYRTIEQRTPPSLLARPGFYDRVWLKSATGARCQIRLGGKIPVKAPPTPKVEKGKSSVPKDIADKIKKISETEFNIERSVVDNILENQAELMKSARIVPEKEGDKVVGIRLFGIKPDSLLGTLGIENGDRLGAINGYEMGNPQSALEAYTKLRTADQLNVAVNRHGKPVNIVFNIK